MDRSEDHGGATEPDAEVVVTERIDASNVKPPRDARVADARGNGEFGGEPEDASASERDASASVDAGASTPDASERDAGASEPDAGQQEPEVVDAGVVADAGVEDAAVDAGVVVPDAGATPPAGCTSQTFESRPYLFCTQPRNWIDGRNVCIRAMMDIVVVNSAAESMFVAGNGDSWIGATDIDGEGRWVVPVPGNSRDYSGANVSYTNWIAGQPDNLEWCAGVPTPLCIGLSSDEDCAMARAPDGLWNDSECSRTRNFVCEQL